MFSILDDFRYELKFENGKLKSFAEQKIKVPSGGSGRLNNCIAWYFVTTFYYADGASSTFELPVYHLF